MGKKIKNKVDSSKSYILTKRLYSSQQFYHSYDTARYNNRKKLRHLKTEFQGKK